MGGSLGQWVPGVVDDVQLGTGNRFRYVVMSRGGQRLVDLLASQVRNPRRAAVDATVPTRQNRTVRKRKETREGGRGPLRYDNFRRWVKARPCIFCECKADDPHHYGPKGTGQTTDDTRIVPVCRKAHDALHARRPQDLCAPTAYVRDDEHHAWAVIEAHVFRWQVNLITEYLRYNGVMG